MAPRVRPSQIKNKIKREDVHRTQRREKRQDKLKKRLVQAEIEERDPDAKKRRVEANVPKTLDNMREFDQSMLAPNPAGIHPSLSAPQSLLPEGTTKPTASIDPELAQDIESDPFAAYFSAESGDPSKPPKVLITTSQRATKVTYNFCDELVGVVPGAEFIRRKKGRGFEMGKVATWAAARDYGAMIVVNEDTKKPNALTIIHLPNGPTAYFKLTSVQLTKEIFGHARASPHYPELVLNGFVTRLGHAVGRMWQTLYPPMPEFEGRQVVTLHNQRDFLFFRRHRYMFKSTEKAALQEIGPRFTLKLRWMKKGLPSVQNLGAAPPKMELAPDEEEEDGGAEKGKADPVIEDNQNSGPGATANAKSPSTMDEYIWVWKPELETTRRTFFL